MDYYQMVLVNGTWKLWSITIDEFYWRSANWTAGLAGAELNVTASNSTEPQISGLARKYHPDVSLVDLGERQRGFQGGMGRIVQWPEIQTMWFGYRNPVTGRTPEHFWEGFVPCRVRGNWSLSANGYQEPPPCL